MKKLLMTTAMIGLMISPAVADKLLIRDGVELGPTSKMTTVKTRTNPDGSITETTITETVTPRTSTSLMVTSEVSEMDLLKSHDWDGDGDYDHKHTIITIEGMTAAELNARIGDRDGDGDIDRFDLATYVGDRDLDGDVDYIDYMDRFGDQAIRVEYSYNYPPNYDGTTAYISPSVQAVIIEDDVNIDTSKAVRLGKTEVYTDTDFMMNR